MRLAVSSPPLPWLVGQVLGDEREQAPHRLVPTEMQLTIVERLPAVGTARHSHFGTRRIDLPHLDLERLVAQFVGAMVGDDAATSPAAEVECTAVGRLAQLDTERPQHRSWRLRRAAAAR